MVIQHNMLAMNGSRNLNITKGKLGKSTEKLSSGHRINRAADDAASLCISEKIRSQIRGLNQASNNLQDGISLTQVADGALNETHAMLQRMNELSIQSANDTNTAADRAMIQKEAAELINGINSIAHGTNFNSDIYPLLGSNIITKGTPDPGYSSKLGNVNLNSNGSIDIFAQEDPGRFIGSTDTFGVLLRVNDGTTTKNISLGARYPTPGFETTSVIKNKISDTEFEYEYKDTASGIHFKIKQTHGIVTDKGDDRGGEYCDIHYDFTNLGPKEVTYDIMMRMDPISGDMPSVPTLDGNQLTGSTLLDFSGGGQNGTLICNPKDFPKLNCDVTAIVTGSQIVNNPSSVYYGDMSFTNPGYPSFDHMDGSTNLSPDSGGINYHYVTAWMGNKVASGASYEVNSLYGVSYPYAGTGTMDQVLNSDVWIQSGAERDIGFDIPLVDATAENLGINNIDVSTEQGAKNSIGKVQAAIDKVSGFRSQFGSYQNCMEYSIKNVDNTAENLQAAESGVRDTDMAKEMVEFSKQKIMEQAGQAVLSQANQAKEMILTILR